MLNNMKKEVTIEDFISKEELDSMTDHEREIYNKVFLMNKSRLQCLTDDMAELRVLENIINYDGVFLNKSKSLIDELTELKNKK
jgi:hypothetical protein